MIDIFGHSISSVSLFLFGFLEIFSAVMIFKLKDMLHVAISLSIVFFFNSIIFLVAGQPLLAVVQLFIMVGGISTYFVVGVASASLSNFKHVRILPIFLSSLILFMLLLFGLRYQLTMSGNPNPQISLSSISMQIADNVSLFYILALLVFGASIGSILIFRGIGVKG